MPYLTRATAIAWLYALPASRRFRRHGPDSTAAVFERAARCTRERRSLGAPESCSAQAAECSRGPRTSFLLSTVTAALTCFSLILAAALGAAPVAHAQSDAPPMQFDADGVPMYDETGASNANLLPWENYADYIHKRAGVTTLGVDAFGDSVSLYNGALSFSVTDISVAGNSGLPVALTRTMSVSHKPDFYAYDRPFADWDLDLPKISGVYGQTWPNNRCSDTLEPPTVFAGATAYPAFDYWQGLHADMPHGGELLVADRSTPRPATRARLGQASNSRFPTNPRAIV